MTNKKLEGEPYSEPEDLGLKIGSKEEVFWENIKLKLEMNILNAEQSLMADKEVLKLANRRIREEKEKFK